MSLQSGTFEGFNPPDKFLNLLLSCICDGAAHIWWRWGGRLPSRCLGTPLSGQIRTIGAMNCGFRPSHGFGAIQSDGHVPLKVQQTVIDESSVCLTIVNNHKIDCQCCHDNFGLNFTIDKLYLVFKSKPFCFIWSGQVVGVSQSKVEVTNPGVSPLQRGSTVSPNRTHTAFTALLHHLFKPLSAAKRGHLASPGKLFGRDNM